MTTDVTIPNSVKFFFGGSAGMFATLFVHPLDVVKNRMQMSGEGSKVKPYKNSFDALGKIMRNEGILAVYSGLSAGLLRQATYTTTRLGVYTTLFDHFSEPNVPPNFLMKSSFGVVAGLIGSFIGTPAELTLIRMASDGRLPLKDRRGYKNVFDALFRVIREEGFLTLWRGCLPTMARAAVVNLAQLASYSQSKQVLLQYKVFSEGISLHFGASMISGLITTIASMPIDILKTRIQNMKIVNGVPEYSSGFDAFRRVVGKEGFFSLWKGFTPYYLRLGPHTVITFIILEQMNIAYKRYARKGDDSKK